MTSRRHFLKTTALSGLGAVACSDLRSARERVLARSFAQESETDEPGSPTHRAAYDLDPGLRYLNHASIGTIPRPVNEAHAEYMRACERNPWAHVWGDVWTEAFQRTRALLATYLQCRTEELAFVRNTTEAFNLLAQGLPLGAGDEVLFSTLNHVGASACWEYRAGQRGYSVRRFEFPLAEAEALSREQIVELHIEAIREETRVLVVPHIDNLLGIHLPLHEIATQARARGVEYIAVDGAQAVGMVPVDLQAAGIDFYATSLHKWLQAPKGTGLLYANAAVQGHVDPLCVTWGQVRWQGDARKFEDHGTRDFPRLLTLEVACRFQQAIGMKRKHAHLASLRERTRERVAGDPRLRWWSPRQDSLGSGLYLIGIEGLDAREVFRRLYEKQGYVFRPFHDQNLNAIRISPNTLNDASEIEALFDALNRLLA